MVKRYTRTKSGEMIQNPNGGWLQYHHYEELLQVLQRLVLSAENIDGEHVNGLQQLEKALSVAYPAINKALGK